MPAAPKLTKSENAILFIFQHSGHFESVPKMLKTYKYIIYNIVFLGTFKRKKKKNPQNIMKKNIANALFLVYYRTEESLHRSIYRRYIYRRGWNYKVW